MAAIFLLLALTFSVFGADLESVGSIPSSTLDSLGDTAGGYGSGSAYDAKAGILYLTSDRGPGDGTIDYSPRLFAISLPNASVNVNEPSSAAPTSVGTQAPASNPAPEPSRSEAQPLRAGAEVNFNLNLNSTEPSSARFEG